MKPITDIILTSEMLKVFPIKSGRRQERPLSPLLFYLILEVLGTKSDYKKKEKKTQLEKK